MPSFTVRQSNHFAIIQDVICDNCGEQEIVLSANVDSPVVRAALETSQDWINNHRCMPKCQHGRFVTKACISCKILNLL